MESDSLPMIANRGEDGVDARRGWTGLLLPAALALEPPRQAANRRRQPTRRSASRFRCLTG